MTDKTPMMLVDREGVIRLWNNAAEAQFGHAPADLVGRSMDVLIVPAFHERHWAGFGAAMKRTPDFQQPVANVPITHADGVVRYSPMRFVTIIDTTGAAAGMLGVFGERGDPGTPNGFPDLFPDALSQN